MHDVFDTINKENRIRGLINQKTDDLKDEIMKYIKEMRANDLEYNEEQRKEMSKSHSIDVNLLDDLLGQRIDRLTNIVQEQAITIGELWTAVNNMRYDLDRLKEGL